MFVNHFVMERIYSITENNDFELLSKNPELNHVMKHYFKKATNKNYEGTFLKLFDIYLRKLGLKMTKKKKKTKKKKTRKKKTKQRDVL